MGPAGPHKVFNAKKVHHKEESPEAKPPVAARKKPLTTPQCSLIAQTPVMTSSPSPPPRPVIPALVNIEDEQQGGECLSPSAAAALRVKARYEELTKRMSAKFLEEGIK